MDQEWGPPGKVVSPTSHPALEDLGRNLNPNTARLKPPKCWDCPKPSGEFGEGAHGGASRLGQEPSTAPAQPVPAPSRLLLQDAMVLGKWGGQGWVLGPVRAGEGMEVEGKGRSRRRAERREKEAGLERRSGTPILLLFLPFSTAPPIHHLCPTCLALGIPGPSSLFCGPNSRSHNSGTSLPLFPGRSH